VFHIFYGQTNFDILPVRDWRAGLDPLALLLLEEVGFAGGNLRPDGVGEHAGAGVRAHPTGLAAVGPRAPVSHLNGKQV
jgi:hypothetical protein